MKRIKITPLTQKVLREHKISHRVYNELDKYEKIAVSTQLRRWGRVSTPQLKELLFLATLKHGIESV